MKKLFFTALVAVAAVGGAYATTGNFYSEFATSQDVFCTSGAAACSSYYSPPAYDKPADDASRVQITLSNFEHAL